MPAKPAQRCGIGRYVAPKLREGRRLSPLFRVRVSPLDSSR